MFEGVGGDNIMCMFGRMSNLTSLSVYTAFSTHSTLS
jgi:hypothetical protein